MMNSAPTSHEATSHEEFVGLFARNQRRVFAYICALLPSVPDAEEVMQETSIILWRKWSEFDPDRDFVRWANGIAHREVLHFLRQRKRGQVYFSDEMLAHIADEHEHHAEQGEDARQAALLWCLSKLSEKDRDLIRRRYQGESTVSQVAKALKRPLKSIYRSLERARVRLLECVQRKMVAEKRK